jgi:molybdate transport system substrate-binding protein
MQKHVTQLCTVIAILLGICPGLARADELRIAVAANFTQPLSQIARLYETSTGNRVILIPGSTGKHFAQISNGAPFDIFYAADAKRPELLEAAGLGIAGSRYNYAIGRLVLWSPLPGFVDPDGAVLATDSFRYLAIANPKLAPYGRAAQETLERMNQWERLQPKLVRGENISQAMHFVRSGNAELGLLARSQLVVQADAGSSWPVPERLHTPIMQQAIALRDTQAVRQFMQFSRSAAAREIIRNYGYDLPDTVERAN